MPFISPLPFFNDSSPVPNLNLDYLSFPARPRMVSGLTDELRESVDSFVSGVTQHGGDDGKGSLWVAKETVQVTKSSLLLPYDFCNG